MSDSVDYDQVKDTSTPSGGCVCTIGKKSSKYTTSSSLTEMFGWVAVAEHNFRLVKIEII